MNGTETLVRLNLPEATLEYSDRGAGLAVVLVHAGMVADWFAPVAARAELDGFRVIRVRRAGYADGPTPGEHLRIEDHAAHLEALLEETGVRQAVVCGHSSSAFMALQLAMDRPDRIAGLVLIEPALGRILDGPIAEEFARSTVAPAMQAARSGSVDEALETWMTGVAGPDWRGVLERAFGPGAVRTVARQSAFFFRDEGPAVREWQFDDRDAA